MKLLTIVTVIAILAAACGRAPQAAPPNGDRLYEAVSTRSGPLVDILDAGSHHTLGVLPLGVASPDWKHYYAVRGGVLEDIDPHSGATLHTLSLARPYAVPVISMNGMTGGLSQNGRWLVLETPGAAQSHLLVVDTTYALREVHVDLDGSFQFDGISDDGARLYLLHYLGGSDYQVRWYSVTDHSLAADVIIDKNDPTEPMTGRRLQTVISAQAGWQFTVYARERKGAFIHALSLDAPYSLCFDLPGAGWSTDPGVFRWSLALSPDGTKLYAANGALGLVVELSTGAVNGPEILRTRALPRPAAQAGLGQPVAAKELGSGGAAVSPDGRTLVMAAAHGVQWIDTSTLQPARRALGDWTVWSLGLAPGGTHAYAIRDTGEIAELAPGAAVLDSFDPQAGQPLALMRVEAAP